MSDVADADAEADADHDEEAAVEGEDAASGGTDGPDELVARVAAVDEALAGEVEAVRERVGELEATVADREARVEELESKLTRARADFQNYKKRAEKREEDLRERATEELVERLLDVRDNLVRALEQDEDVEVRDGVEATLATFDRILDAENVSAIEPADGDEVDPERHEVVHRTESDRPAGAIVDVYRPGYAMAGKVLRPAQVTVSEGAAEGAEDTESETGD